MAKRSIDMLPLLDVFMVVLFVFATIQEQQLDSSVQELDDATAALAVVNTELAEQAATVDALSAELAQLEARSEGQAETAAELAELVERYERECGPGRPDGPVCPAAKPASKAQAAVAAVHERLLSNLAVFEVQLEGDPDLTTGKLRTRCCFRADPPAGEWRSCGEVPSEEHEQLAWIEAGADGLVAGLEDARGEGAVVLLSQGISARYLTSKDLAALLRDRFPGFRVYDDGTTAGPTQCPAPDR